MGEKKRNARRRMRAIWRSQMSVVKSDPSSTPVVLNNMQITAYIKDLLAKRQPPILHRQYATFRPDIVEYFVTNVLPQTKIITDPMCGTAPLIPYVEHLGLTAYFNDILPVFYHVNKAKTYKIYRSIPKLKHTVLLSELKQCFLKLKKKQLIMSEKWIRDDILEALSYTWEKTSKYPISRSIFYKAIIVLAIREYKRKARTGRNPRTGETITIKAAKVPKFKAGKGLKEFSLVCAS